MAQTDYEDDKVIEDIQDEMYQREEKRPQSAFSKLDPRTKMWSGILGGTILIAMWVGKISVRNGLFGLGVGVLILWLMKSSDPQRTELTWMECMIRMHDLLRLLQRHPIGLTAQIPKGRIHIKPIGRKQWYEGAGWKRSFAVDIYDAIKDITTMYFVEVDTFTGDIITFKESPEGVYGDETKDVKLMPTYDMLMRKKAEEYLGRGRRRI